MRGMVVECPHCGVLAKLSEFDPASEIEPDPDGYSIAYSDFAEFFSERSGLSDIGEMVAAKLGFKISQSFSDLVILDDSNIPAVLEALFIFLEKTSLSLKPSIIGLWRFGDKWWQEAFRSPLTSRTAKEVYAPSGKHTHFFHDAPQCVRNCAGQVSGLSGQSLGETAEWQKPRP